MADLPTNYQDSTTPTGALTELPATGSRGINAICAAINAANNGLNAALTTGDIPHVLVWTGTAWPNRPADSRPAIFVGGSVAPGDTDLLDGDVWLSDSGSVSSGGGGGGVANPVLPSPLVVEELASGPVVSVTAGGTATTISGGIVAANLSSPAGKVGLIGTKSSQLLAVSGRYAPAWRNSEAAGTYGTSTVDASFTLDFWVVGSRYVEFGTSNTSGYGAYAYRVWVDDRRMTDLPVITGMTANSTNTLKVDVQNTQPHRVRFEMVNIAVGNIWVEATGIVWAANIGTTRVAFLGDSSAQGFSTSHTGWQAGAWFSRWCNLVGIRDYWSAAEHGTGPNTTAAGGNLHNFKTRASTEIATTDANLVLMGTYINDKTGGRSAAQIAADFGTTIDTLQTMATAPNIIIWGAVDATGANGSDYTTIDAAVRAVCVSKGAAWVSGTTGEVVDYKGTTVLQTQPWINAANTATYLDAAHAYHLTDAGHRFVAYMMRSAYAAIIGANES